MTTAVAQRNQEKIATVRQLLERNQAAIMAALPNHMDSTRFLRIALTSFQKTPKLLECTPESFLGAVIQSAQLGLEPDGVTGMAHLIPYGGKVNFQVGFQGLMDLARRSGDISQIIPRVVHQNDTFRFAYGLEKDELHHQPCGTLDPGPVTHVYCIVRLENGSTQFEAWTKDQIDAHRKRYSKASQAKMDSPWETHWEQMAMKTMIIRALKYAPKSVALQKAIGLAEMADSGIDQKLDSSWITTVSETPSEAPQTQLDKIAQDKAPPAKKQTAQLKADDAAEKKRQKVRKGKLSDDQLAEVQKAALACGLSPERLVEILGTKGYETLDEVPDTAFKGLMSYLGGLKA